MATRAERIKLVIQAIGVDIKALKTADGNLSLLSTTEKTNIVGAINEIYALVSDGTGAGALINDMAGDGDSDVVWSADKVYDSILIAKNEIKDELVNGAGAALDTLKELADALNNNPSFATDIALALTKRVRVDDAQSFTATEKKQGCDNLGIGDPDYNFVTDYTAAKV